MGEISNEYIGKKILITGGLGFMGSNLARRLVSLGSEVSLLDANISPYGSNRFNVKDIENDVEITEADIRDKDIAKWLKDKDIIFNLAGQVGHYSEKDHPDYIKHAITINYEGHLNMLTQCLEVNPKARIIHPGSIFQYGQLERIPVDEEHPSRPDSRVHYAITKQRAEDAYREFHREKGMNTVMLRISNPYGPRSQMKHPNYSFLNWFIRLAMDGEAIPIFGDGEQLKDPMYIDDLVDALLHVGVCDGVSGELINVGLGRGYKIREIAETVVDVVGSGRIEFKKAPEKYNASGINGYISDISKIKRLTGWQPKTELREGIKKTFEFYREHRNNYWTK